MQSIFVCVISKILQLKTILIQIKTTVFKGQTKRIQKRCLKNSSTQCIIKIRKVLGYKIRCPQLKQIKKQHPKLQAVRGCYFLLCRLSMYANAVNITNNKVKTSIVSIGITLLQLLEGNRHTAFETCILYFPVLKIQLHFNM